jgi:subtilisin-like proprotein convertase family protein
MRMNVTVALGCVLACGAALSAGSLITDFGPGVGGAIPDGNTLGFITPIIIDESFVITGVEVILHGLQHNYSSDLTITLTHTGVSTPITLVVNLRNGSGADFDGTYTFSDAGADLWVVADGIVGTNDIPPGAYMASSAGGTTSSLNAKYAGENAHGAWYLRIVDDDALVAGSVQGWTLRLNPGATPPAECAGDTNGDHVVDGADLSVLLARFGTSCK